MQLIYGRTDRRPFSTILYQYSDNEFHNLTRSTVPFLCYWKTYYARLEKLSNMINIHLSENITFCFEFPVESYESNKPSFTDLMILSENYAFGIEGKWTETKYENVGEWLQKGNKSNRINVLKLCWFSVKWNILMFKLVHWNGGKFDEKGAQKIFTG